MTVEDWKRELLTESVFVEDWERELAALKAYRRKYVLPVRRREWREYQATQRPDAERLAQVFAPPTREPGR